MARPFKIGIQYYSMDIDHVSNSKIKLLFNEFDSHGYWIYKCLLSEIYGKKGYYMDISDKDNLTLFAGDVCKKPVSLVEEVIKGCVRRDLFDKGLFDLFNVITSDRIQENFLEATSERRRKGTKIEMYDEFLLIHIDENDKISVVPRNNLINPRKNGINPHHSTQSKVKKSKEKKSKAVGGLIFPFDSIIFLEKWTIWKDYKKSQFNFSFKSEIAEQAQLKELSELSGGDEKTAIAIIEQSITKAWKGLFQIKNQKNGTDNNRKTVRNYTAEDFGVTTTG